jgi:hypothetical protein
MPMNIYSNKQDNVKFLIEIIKEFDVLDKFDTSAGFVGEKKGEKDSI